MQCYATHIHVYLTYTLHACTVTRSWLNLSLFSVSDAIPRCRYRILFSYNFQARDNKIAKNHAMTESNTWRALIKREETNIR